MRLMDVSGLGQKGLPAEREEMGISFIFFLFFFFEGGGRCAQSFLLWLALNE